MISCYNILKFGCKMLDNNKFQKLNFVFRHGSKNFCHFRPPIDAPSQGIFLLNT